MTVTEAYRLIAPAYDSAPNPLLALEQRILKPLLPHGRSVADIGAGTGRWLHHFQSRGANTIAIDISPEMLASAPPPRICANATSLPLRSNSADVVLCTFTLGYEPACFPELVRITRPTGTLIVTDVHPDAIARGWSRSFRIGEEIIEPRHHAYTIDQLTHPSLTRTHLIEPHIGEPERPIFERAGKLASYEAACAHPALFIAIWSKQ